MADTRCRNSGVGRWLHGIAYFRSRRKSDRGGRSSRDDSSSTELERPTDTSTTDGGTDDNSNRYFNHSGRAPGN
jgi:hypothetical protein